MTPRPALSALLVLALAPGCALFGTQAPPADWNPATAPAQEERTAEAQDVAHLAADAPAVDGGAAEERDSSAAALPPAAATPGSEETEGQEASHPTAEEMTAEEQATGTLNEGAASTTQQSTQAQVEMNAAPSSDASQPEAAQADAPPRTLLTAAQRQAFVTSTIEEAESYVSACGVDLLDKQENKDQIVAPRGFRYTARGSIEVSILQFNSPKAAVRFKTAMDEYPLGSETRIVKNNIVFSIWGGDDAPRQALIAALK